MLKKLLSRTAITAVIILVQIVWIVALLLRLSDALPVMNYVLRILSLVAVLHVIKNDMDPSYKVSWVLFIALLPLFGGLMYVLFGNKRPTRFIRDKLNVQLEETQRYYTLRSSDVEEIDDDDARGLFKYLESYSGYRACRDTKTEYFPVGEDMFARLIPELEKAEEFIFLEYFIINSGQMWNSVLDVLRRKVAQGVDVRVIYDDVGCADYLPANYCQTLRSYGIKAMVFNKFVPAEYEEKGGEGDGYILSFSDSPLDDENTSESVYTDILYNASDYVYITTPYLAVDSSLQNALCLAAKRGVDVRLITPGIPDKKLVYRLTRSYYAALIRAGVKIYEYTLGFVHAKSYVSDDKLGVVGTINMDYRSLYLHFECGTLMYDSPAVIDLRNDDLATIEKCRRIELSDCRTSFFGELIDRVLRVIAPLL